MHYTADSPLQPDYVIRAENHVYSEDGSINYPASIEQEKWARRDEWLEAQPELLARLKEVPAQREEATLLSGKRQLLGVLSPRLH